MFIVLKFISPIPFCTLITEYVHFIYTQVHCIYIEFLQIWTRHGGLYL